ncbi:MAG: class I SAM-dependent methyltransferase [Deltaproteobacteria bacterium]|nr:class I SAM-dependent methyltransferase [Deltaproteobacteria bacterium]
MTSTQAEIDVSYSVSNDFFKLWLDENMHYTCAVYERPDQSLEEAQENKARVLYDFAELSADKTVLDIGCGWGSMLDYCVRRGVKRAEGVTLSTAQAEWCFARKLPRTQIHICDYRDWKPAEKYGGLVSIEMIDHLCSPAQAREGKAIDIYRQYFNKLAEWVEPGAHFGFQAILTNRIPRKRQDLLDLQFTADVIFPGGRNPRVEELVAAVNPNWEIRELHMRREDYGRTTGEWLRRMRQHEAYIRQTWGDALFDDYERYLDTCVRGFAAHWSGDVQMKLRRI